MVVKISREGLTDLIYRATIKRPRSLTLLITLYDLISIVTSGTLPTLSEKTN